MLKFSLELRPLIVPFDSQELPSSAFHKFNARKSMNSSTNGKTVIQQRTVGAKSKNFYNDMEIIINFW